MIDLVTRFQPLTDEKFASESKKEIVTNNDFSWEGAKAINLYKLTTTQMNDYDRAGTSGNISRFGELRSLDATTELLELTKDRSFTFVIDKLDEDETAMQLTAATALERQLREVVIPEVDKYTYSVMCENAGTKPPATSLTKENIYLQIIQATKELDNAEVPEVGRVLLVTPDTYFLMKQCKDIILDTDIAQEMRNKGVIGMLDGLTVIKIPATRLPDDFGFMVVHPVATAAPTKLADYRIHQEPPMISGSLIEGRINYDAFVLDNKAKGIYYQATS